MESSDERLESRPKSTWLGTFTCIEPYIYTIIYGITKCNLYPLLSKGLWKPWPCLRGRSCAALGHQIPLKGYIHNIILSLPHNEDGKNTFPSQFLCDPHHVYVGWTLFHHCACCFKPPLFGHEQPINRSLKQAVLKCSAVKTWRTLAYPPHPILINKECLAKELTIEQ